MTISYFWKITDRPEPTILGHIINYFVMPSLTKIFMWVSFMNTTTWLNFGAYVTKIWKKLCLKFVGPHSIFFLCVISHYKNMPDYGFSISSASSFRKSKSTFKPPVFRVRHFGVKYIGIRTDPIPTIVFDKYPTIKFRPNIAYIEGKLHHFRANLIENFGEKKF